MNDSRNLLAFIPRKLHGFPRISVDDSPGTAPGTVGTVSVVPNFFDQSMIFQIIFIFHIKISFPTINQPHPPLVLLLWSFLLAGHIVHIMKYKKIFEY